MKSPKAVVAALAILAVVSALLTYKTRPFDAWKDAPSEIGSIDIKGMKEQSKERTGKETQVKGKAVHGTSAVANMTLSLGNGSIKLLDLERQSDPSFEWTYIVQGKLVSDRNPKGVPVTMYNTEIETHRPYDPNRRPENPITEFTAYFDIRRDGFSSENIREESPDVPYRKLAAIAVNTADTVRLLYKQEVVGKVEVTPYPHDRVIVDIVPNTVGHDEAPNGIWLDEHTPVDITLIDGDLNLDPNSKDQTSIRVYSDSDRKGITVSLIETHEYSANFVGQFRVTTRKTEPYTLHVRPGDQVYAVYVDEEMEEGEKPVEAVDYVKVFRRKAAEKP